MATEVKRRRGTTAQHLDFIGAEAEITVDIEKYTLLVHDDSGTKPTGHELLRADFSNAVFTVPDGRYLLETNNLSDLPNKATARTNLGIGNVENTALSTYTGQGGALDNQYITNGAGYITGYTETDPVFSASEAASITSTDTTQWDAAYTYSQVGHLPLTGGTISQNLTISGNLTVSGTTTTVNTETINLADNIITLNSNFTGNNPTENAGIEVERGDLTNKSFFWNETTDQWNADSALVASSFIKQSNTGGFLKADGTEDTSTYLTTVTEAAVLAHADNYDHWTLTVGVTNQDIGSGDALTLTAGTGISLSISGANVTIDSTISDGDITAVNTQSNSGLSGGSTSGDIDLSLDISNLTAITTADSQDPIAILDGSTTKKITLGNIPISAFNDDSTFLKDADFTSNGFLKRTGDGTYAVDTNTYLTSETSHSDVVVDGDFTTAGFMKTDGSGTYSVDNSTFLTSVSSSDVTQHLSVVTQSATGGGELSLVNGEFRFKPAAIPTGLITAVNTEATSGLSGGASSGDVSLTLDATALTADTTLTSTDVFIIGQTGATKKIAASNIDLSLLDNSTSGFTNNVGTITGVAGGAGLDGSGTSGTVTLSHSDTSSQSSVNNSGVSVIQDVTLDTYGHVTGLTSKDLVDEFVPDKANLVLQNAASGGGSLSYNQTNKQFEYTPPAAATGDITEIVTNTNSGLNGGTTSGVATLSFNISNLVDMTEDVAAIDEIAILDGTTNKRKPLGEIDISVFNNDAGFGAGDITGVTAGAGLSGGGTSGAVTLSHSDTSSQASVDNSNGSVIQDVTLDAYGHVTGLTSVDLDSRYLELSGGILTGGLNIGNGNQLKFYSASGAYANADARNSGNGARIHRFNRNSANTGYLPYYENWYDGNSYHSIGVENDVWQISDGLDVSGRTKVYSAIGASDNVRTGLAHYDTTAMAVNVGGQLVLGYKYDTGGTYTEGAILKTYKENGTSGQYGSGLKFQVRNHGAILSTKMILDPSGNVGINNNNPSSSYKLDVNGAGHFVNDLILDEDLVVDDTLYVGNTNSGNHKLYVEGGASHDVVAKFKTTGAGTSDYSEIHIENNAGNRTVLGSIGSNYAAADWTNSSYLYNTGSGRRFLIKSQAEMIFTTGGTSLTSNKRMTITSGGQINMHNTLKLESVAQDTSSTSALVYAADGTQTVKYRTLGSNAFNSTTIPTDNNQLTNGANYITGYTETDPIFSASAASNIATSDINNWNNAYNNTISGVSFDTSTGVVTVSGQQGDYNTVSLDGRYYTETEVNNFFGGTTTITGYNKSNWDSSYQNSLSGVQFNTGTGVLTVSAIGGSYTTDLDGRYLTSFDITTQTDPKYLRSNANDTTTGNITIGKADPVFILNDTSTNNSTNLTSFVSFRAQGTEKGFVGYGSGGNNYLYVRNNDGRVDIQGTEGIYLNSDTEVIGSITLDDSEPIKWDTNNILSHNGTATYLGDATSASVLTLSGGNATFEGRLIATAATNNDFNGHHFFTPYDSNGNHYPHYKQGASSNGAQINLRVQNSGGGYDVLYVAAGNNNISWRGNTLWNQANDGSGSGLDADLLDGQEGSYYTNSANLTGTISDVFDANTRYNIGVIDGSSAQTRDKLRVWTSGHYAIGMMNGYNYGHIGTNEYAMSFQMNNNNGRGFWWGHNAHTNSQGAMSLTNNGKLTVSTSVSIGEGDSVTSPSSTTLYVSGDADITGNLDVDGDVQVGTQNGTVKIGGSETALGLTIDYNQSSATTTSITSNPSYTNASALMILRVDGDSSSTANQLVLKGDGNVGIGETSPSAKLHMSAASPSFYLDDTSTTGTRTRFQLITGDIGSTQSALFSFNNTSATSLLDVMTLNETGNVLIGRTSDVTSQKLQVNGYIDITDVTSTALRWYDGSTFRGGLGLDDWATSGAANDITLYGMRHLFFVAGGGNNKRMTIQSDGKVGIGTDSPSDLLHLSGNTNSFNTAPLIRFDSTSTANANVRNWAIGPADSGYGNFHIYKSATRGGDPVGSTQASTFTIDYNGNVGIGTTNPQAKLDVEGGILSSGALAALSASNIFIDQPTSILSRIGVVGPDASTAGTLRISQYSSNGSVGRDVIQIDSSGNVGIGITNPSDYFANFNDLVVGSTSADSGITIVSSTSDDGTLAFADGTSGTSEYSGYIQYSHGTDNLSVGTAGAERMRIDSSGQVYFKSSTAYKIGLNDSAGVNQWWLKSSTNGDFAIHENGVGDQFTIEAGGNVGIGQTSPSGKLQIDNASGNTLVLRKGTGTPAIAFGGASGNEAVALLEGISGGGFKFYTGAGTLASPTWSPRMVLNSSGNVGINYTSPIGQLHVDNNIHNKPTLVVSNYSTGGSEFEFQRWQYVASSTNYRLGLFQEVTSGLVKYRFDLVNNGTNYTSNLVLDRGNVGIGDDSPSYKLDVNGSGRFVNDLILDEDLVVADNIYLSDTNTKLTEGAGNSLRIETSTGYVDVGSMNSSYLHMQTDRPQFYFNKQLVVDTGIVESYNEDLQLRRAASSTDKLTIKDNEFEFNLAGATQAKIEPNGKFTLITSTTTKPSINSGASGTEVLNIESGDLNINSSHTYINDNADVDGNLGVTGDITVGSIDVNGGMLIGGTTFSKNTNAYGTGNIALDNGSNDSGGIHFYYANNTNFGIDVASSEMRFVHNLDESGGSVKMSLNTSGDLDLSGDLDVGGTTTVAEDANALLIVGTTRTSSFTSSDTKLELRGKNLQAGSQYYGDYGQLLFNSTTNYTGTARDFLLTNALGTNKFAIIQGTTANVAPTIGAAGALTNGTARFVIDSAGNTGIGTDSPISKLHVIDSQNIAANATGDGQLSVGGNGYTFAVALDAQAAHIYHNSSVRNIEIGTNEGTDLTIHSNGNVSIADGNLIVAAGHGVDFSANQNNSGMTSELLDDYEEGTFTPSIHAGASSPTYHSNNYGKYTKVGNVVHCSGRFQVTSIQEGGSSTNVEIGGFPFNCSVGLGTGTGAVAGSIGFASGFDGESPTMIQIRNNENNAFLYYQNSSLGISNLKGNDFTGGGAHTIVFQITYHTA